MSLEVVQEFLGHVDVSTTRGIYAPVPGVQVVRSWLENLDAPPGKAAGLVQ
jgi:site-specific recombinase XerD